MLKKITLFLCILSAVLLFTGCWNTVPYIKPEVPAAHHGDKQFISAAQNNSPLWSYLQMRFREGRIHNPSVDELKSIQTTANLTLIHSHAKHPRVTWLGHASTLVQYQNINFLTDPHLTEFASPLPLVGPKRLIPPALRVDQLPAIDFVVISHNHYDHLDSKTVKALGNQTIWVVPLGLKLWMVDKGIDEDRVIELDWWQKWSYIEGVEVIAAPSQHWSKRTPFDTNHTLWASWHINIHGFKSWFAGDTGYNQEKFTAIGNQLGPHHLSLIPIGAYGPRYFMQPQHVDPQQAIQIHKDVRAQFTIGIHWGTFALTHEPLLEPATLLKELLLSETIDGSFTTIKVGETQTVKLE